MFFKSPKVIYEAQYHQKKKKKEKWERHACLQNASNFSHDMTGKCSRRINKLRNHFPKIFALIIDQDTDTAPDCGVDRAVHLVYHWERGTQRGHCFGHMIMNLSGSNQRIYIKKDLKLQRYML